MTLGPLCSTCVLKKSGGSGYAVSRGKATHGVVIVGEALGEDEVAQGKPFVGKAGQFLDRIISRTKDPETGRNLDPDDFLITNIIRCRPWNNILTGASFEHEAIDHCAPYLKGLLKKVQPKAILGLGNQPLRWFTKEWGIESLRGYVWKTDFGPVVGTYHPSYLLRGKLSLVRVVQMDILKSLYLARHGLPTFDKDYVLHPTTLDLRRFCEDYRESLRKDPSTFLSADIETPWSGTLKDGEIDPETEEINIEDDASYQILRISFSFKPGHAITMPWAIPYTDYIKELLEMSGSKIFWNGLNFDIPRIEASGVMVNGRIYDGMDLFHFLEPGFPMGLKYVATFYCVSQDTPILTSDLRWVPAGAIKVNTKLLGFDEERQPGRMGREYKETSVISSRPVLADIYKVSFSDGTSVRASAEHRWLAPKSDGYFWVETKAVKPGDRLRRTLTTWQEEQTKDAGYLAGIFDGEGHLSYGNKRSTKLGFAQNENTVLKLGKQLLDDRAFNYAEFKVGDCHRIQLKGGVAEVLRFLGTIRPQRLLKKFRPELLGELRSRRSREVIVTAVEALGQGVVQLIETTSNTLFAAGFPMHNCPDMPAWKLLSHKEPEWYNAADSNVALRCVLAMKAQAKSEDRWGIFERHFVDLAQVLQKMSRRGIRVSRELRRKASLDFEQRYQKTLGELQDLIPIGLRPKKIFKISEESLKKRGTWREGQMVEVTTMEPVKHKHEWICFTEDSLKIFCNCGVLKNKPKSFKCMCHPKLKKERKKRVAKETYSS